MPNYQEAYLKSGLGTRAVHERNVSVKTYNRCRYISSQVLDYFVKYFLKNSPKKIAELGVGNGRLFIPLVEKAEQSTKFIGVDISEPMLDELNQKTSKHPNVNLYKKDIRNVGFFRNNINNVDIAYTFATLHILSENWQPALKSLMYVLSEKGKIILGEEINSVFHGSEDLYENDDYRLFELNKSLENSLSKDDKESIDRFFQEYHRLRELNGIKFKRFNGQVLHGDQSPAERYLRSKGFNQKTISSENLRWIKPHTFEDIIHSIEQRTVTTLGSDLPNKERSDILQRLRKFCRDNQIDIKKRLDVPSEIQLHVFSK